MIVQIIIIQSFTSFRENIAEIFDFENGPFSSPCKRNGSWKRRKIVGTGFCDVIIGELPVQNREQTQQTWGVLGRFNCSSRSKSMELALLLPLEDEKCCREQITLINDRRRDFNHLFESSGHSYMYISSSCCQHTFQKPLGAMCFVMAKLGFKFKPKNKNREAVPNVVIVKPSIYDENPTNKRSASKECCYSAAIL